MILEKNAIILGTFYPQGTEIECTDEVAQNGYKQAAREQTRQAIAERTQCDTDALLGVALDSIHVLAYGLSFIYKAIDSSSSLEELKKRLSVMQDVTGDFLDKVESGEIKLPYLTVKHGVAPVFADLAKTATATTEAMLNTHASI